MVSSLIDPYVSQTKYPQWNCVVAKTNQQTEELINRTDGLCGKLPCLYGCTIINFLGFPVIGKVVIWGMALLMILLVYGSCAI
jgi:hypothetical protein